MAHLTDYEREIKAGARKIAKLEKAIATERAKLEQQKVIEAIVEEVVIKPLEESLAAARARVVEHDKALAESDARMADLRARLAASNLSTKGKK